jgi:hypothetical protein
MSEVSAPAELRRALPGPTVLGSAVIFSSGVRPVTSSLTPRVTGGPGLYRLQPPPRGVSWHRCGLCACDDRLLAVFGGISSTSRNAEVVGAEKTKEDAGCAPTRWVSLLTRLRAPDLPAGPGSSPEDDGEMSHLSSVRSVAGRFWHNLSPGGAPCPIVRSSRTNMET